MSSPKINADEFEIDSNLVQRLLMAQAPQWAHLSLTPVPSAGTDNVLYRLGKDRVVRIPHAWAAGLIEKEQNWLPRLGSNLPLAVPELLAKGQPSDIYPYHWSIYAWLQGEEASLDNLNSPNQAAADLARFIISLQEQNTTDGPPSGPGNFYRGVPLAERDAPTRAAIILLKDMLDTPPLVTAWEKALATAPHVGPAKWVHGDLRPGNLLADQGKLSAVIDFGGLGVGDPACDFQVAWNFFNAGARDVFRQTLGTDEAAWERGKGWALSISIINLPYYWTKNRNLADISRRTIKEIID